ncbi:NACHT domain-containing protein [Streptomyces sp. NPDC001999]
MSRKTNLSAGRQALKSALRDLKETALQGRTRMEAIDEANRQLEQAGLAKLERATVGGWFEVGSPAKDFRSLWALVQVLLEWSGQPSPDTLEGPARGQATARWMATEELWKNRWEQAKDNRPRAASPANPPLVAKYLNAARNAARRHPYPGDPDDPSLPLPALADVYVRQQARTPASGDQDSPSPSNVATSGNQAGPAVPATEVFKEDHHICVLLGGPGGGKSTLLRAHLADSADGWMGGTTGKTIPVMVSAAALTGRDRLLPTALAETATGDLGQFGLLDELTAEFFRHPPRAGVSWLVLVDGLDEIPDTDTRSKVLSTLVGAASAGAGLYRFVVATRPLPATELVALGQYVPRYELQPFSHDDVFTYATQWFRPLDDPGRHANAFIAGLTRSRMEVLARTPLMAFMLCQLYAADPARPLPDGRTGAYELFVKLIYERNSHKQVASTHDKAIRELTDRYQIRRDSEAAEQAAQRVRYHLPDLIDHLAYERINGCTAPAVEIVASHVQASRPPKVEQRLWNSFLTDLLRPTGILAQRGDDFDFLHQTLLEFHAARHATRDEQARTQLLDGLIASSKAPRSSPWKPPDLPPSYLGFLLDGLLDSCDQITERTTQYVEELTAHGGQRVCRFLTTQVFLRTNLPPHPTAAQLGRLVGDTTLDHGSRVRAARALTLVDREAGVARLARLAGNITLHGDLRVQAARALVEVDGEAAAAHLDGIANDATPDATRVQAARALTLVDREAGVAHLARLAGNITLHGDLRVRAARALVEVDGEAAAAHLARFVGSTTLDDFRVRTAEALAQVDREAEMARLALLADDTTLSGADRVQAARALAEVDREVGAVRLVRLADDTSLHVDLRVRAAEALADTARLALLADDTTLSGAHRVRAAEALAQVAGKADMGRLAGLADDTTLDHGSRVRAARALAEVDREVGAVRLVRLADDTTLSGADRVRAARTLARVAGEAAAAPLARLVNDVTLHPTFRHWARSALERVNQETIAAAGRDPYANDSFRRGRAAKVLTEADAARLARLADDTTLSGADRVQAARALAEVDREAAAARLARFVGDTTLDDNSRTWAAEALVEVAGEAAAGHLARLANDTTLDYYFRARAALALAGMDGEA